jgi:hypothetical protein
MPAIQSVGPINSKRHTLGYPSTLSDGRAWFRADRVILGSGVSDLINLYSDYDSTFYGQEPNSQYQPNYIAIDKTANNQPGMYFFTDKRLRLYGIPQAISGDDQPYTMYIVRKVPYNFPMSYFGLSRTTQSGEQFWWEQSTTFRVFRRSMDVAADTGIVMGGSTLIINQPVIITQVYDGQNLTIYQNEDADSTIDNLSFDTNATNFDIGYLGCRIIGNTLSTFAAMWCYEYIFCNTAHDSGTLQNVWNYLADRYGITL